MEQQIQVAKCEECPFLGEENEQKICNLIQYRAHTPESPRGSWIDEEGFDELYEIGIHPLSCPLRTTTITVTLKQE